MTSSFFSNHFSGKTSSRKLSFLCLFSEMESTPIEFFDPHFHIWDLSEDSESGQNFKQTPQLYPITAYESDVDASPLLVHKGGVFLEVMSVCHANLDGIALQDKCLLEAKWVASQLSTSSRQYRMAPSACLEDPNVGNTLKELAAIPGVVGIRQILNHNPHWPRNGALGNLLDNPSWREGYSKLVDVNFSFDMQLNPHQYKAAVALVKEYPTVPVMINHLGTPTGDDLVGEKADVYWSGMEAFAALPHVYIKVSMLCYPSQKWDDGEDNVVVKAVKRVITLFGASRVCFATNYPVDKNDNFNTPRLYAGFVALAEKLSLTPEEKKKMFCENARRFYKVTS